MSAKVDSKFVTFELDGKSESGKTLVYSVVSKAEIIESGCAPARPIIGKILWHGPWRQYAFFPDSGTLFEKQCLRDIANFCEELTKEHLSKKAPDGAIPEASK